MYIILKYDIIYNFINWSYIYNKNFLEKLLISECTQQQSFCYTHPTIFVMNLNKHLTLIYLVYSNPVKLFNEGRTVVFY